MITGFVASSIADFLLDGSGGHQSEMDLMGLKPEGVGRAIFFLEVAEFLSSCLHHCHLCFCYYIFLSDLPASLSFLIGGYTL